MTWTYGPAGWIADLNEYIKDAGQDEPELQLGRRAAGPARLDRLERRAGRRARLGRRQAMVHPLGLRAQQHLLQPEDVREGRREAAEEPAGDGRDLGQAHQGSRRPIRRRRARLALLGHASIRASCRAIPTLASATSPSPTAS